MNFEQKRKVSGKVNCKTRAGGADDTRGAKVRKRKKPVLIQPRAGGADDTRMQELSAIEDKPVLNNPRNSKVIKGRPIRQSRGAVSTRAGRLR